MEKSYIKIWSDLRCKVYKENIVAFCDGKLFASQNLIAKGKKDFSRNNLRNGL